MPKIKKPGVLGDIFPRRGCGNLSSFSSVPRRINLGRTVVFRLPLSKISAVLMVFAAFAFLLLGSVSAPTTLSRAAGQSNDEERRALESQLRELEKEISEYESQIVSYQARGNTLKGEISRLNDRIAKLNLQIRAITLSLRELNNKIDDTQAKIRVTEETISSQRQALARLFQNLYESQSASVIEIFLKNPRLSDFFSDIQGITLLQNSLRVAVAEITDLRDRLMEQNEQLALARADAESARRYQEAQKTEIDATKARTNKLLEITKGEESRYQELVKQTRETASEIRKRIFRLLGGGELSFEEAYEFAKLASGATGVRPALILAVLDRESALGQNVGRCKYNEVNSRTGRQTMHPTRDTPVFLEITKELGIDPELITVSCAIPQDGAYGGAMGPAQFIPSTWMIYRASVAKITGNNPPSPWNYADAFVATALYLRDALNTQACINYSKEIPSQAQILRERCAAARYYAGGNWYNYRWTYGEAVIVHANRFEEDIATINI